MLDDGLCWKSEVIHKAFENTGKTSQTNMILKIFQVGAVADSRPEDLYLFNQIWHQICRECLRKVQVKVRPNRYHLFQELRVEPVKIRRIERVECSDCSKETNTVKRTSHPPTRPEGPANNSN